MGGRGVILAPLSAETPRARGGVSLSPPCAAAYLFSSPSEISPSLNPRPYSFTPQNFALNRIRYRRHDGSVFLYAFDLIELNGDDLRREPLDWLKSKNPASEAVRREREEDWDRRRRR
jgi:hypothetical protein